MSKEDGILWGIYFSALNLMIWLAASKISAAIEACR